MIYVNGQVKIVLACVHFTSHVWPDTCPEDVSKPYFNRRNELSAVNGCILWGARVVIPLAVVLQCYVNYMSLIQGYVQ